MAGASGRKRVTFTLNAPEARSVFVCGTFNDWDPQRHPLKPDGNGGWKAQLFLAPGTYEYRLVVDGEWRDDPNAAERVPNPFGTSNCVLQVPAAR